MKKTLLFLLTCTQVSFSQKCLKTNNEPPESNQPCIFPFTHKETKYDECADDPKKPGKKWCSTQVDQYGQHQKGHFGYCDPDCEISNIQDVGPIVNSLNTTEGPRCKMTNSDGPKTFQSCIFPFIYKTKTYNVCTKDDQREGKYWCSTGTNAAGIHQKGSFGICDPDCDLQTEEVVPLEDYDASILPLPEDENSFCGAQGTAGFITGGRNAKQGSYPFIAAIGKNDPKAPKNIGYVCGGSLINRRYVLTAAHCHSENSPITAVLLGEHDFSRDPDCNDSGCKSLLQEFQIKFEDVHVHPEFDFGKFTSGDDIALVRLPRLAKIEVQDGVVPICLNWKDAIDPAALKYTVAGWGRNTTDVTDAGLITIVGATTSILQEIDVQLFPDEECSNKIRKQKNKHICAVGNSPGQDSCSGDSGGPLVGRTADGRSGIMYLVGIVSYGEFSCEGSRPGVYTNVAHYMPWILKNIRP